LAEQRQMANGEIRLRKLTLATGTSRKQHLQITEPTQGVDREVEKTAQVGQDLPAPEWSAFASAMRRSGLHLSGFASCGRLVPPPGERRRHASRTTVESLASF